MRSNEQESPPRRGHLCGNTAKLIKLKRLAIETASVRYTCANAKQMPTGTLTIVTNRVKQWYRVCSRRCVQNLRGKRICHQWVKKPTPETHGSTEQSYFVSVETSG